MRWMVTVRARPGLGGEPWEHGIEVTADSSVEAVAAGVVEAGEDWEVTDDAPVRLGGDA